MKFKDRYVLATGYPYGLGLDTDVESVQMHRTSYFGKRVKIGWPRALWSNALPRYRLVLERVTSSPYDWYIGWKKMLARAEAAEAALKRVREELSGYCHHEYPCLLSRWHEGRPTKDGGYETRYGDKWYQRDDKPPCTCGLSAILEVKL